MHNVDKLLIACFVFLTEGVLRCCSQERNLTNHLLNTTRYNKRFRPVLHDNHTLGIRHSLILYRIVKVDEKHLKIDLDVRIKMQWKDQNLRWNTSDYGAIRQLNFDGSEIWTPQIILYNNADFDDSDIGSFKATVTYDGNVTWVVPMVTMSSCQINVQNFPLDEQMCKLTFGSWNFDTTKLNIYPDTGERMAVGVTILLSLAVFFLMVEEKMPVSENVPLIGKYYCCTIIEVSLALAAMCHVLRFVHHQAHALPDWIKKYILGFLARVVFYRTEQVKAENEQTPHIRTQTDPKDLRTSRGSEASETAVRVTVNKWRKPLQEKKPEPPAAESRAVKILADSVKEQEKTDELQDEWVLAANVLNRFFMWLFLASVVITLIAVFSVDTRFEN